MFPNELEAPVLMLFLGIKTQMLTKHQSLDVRQKNKVKTINVYEESTRWRDRRTVALNAMHTGKWVTKMCFITYIRSKIAISNAKNFIWFRLYSRQTVV